MMATTRPNPTRQIRRSDLEKFRESIESWKRQGKEAGRDGDLELAAGYAEDVAELRAILRLIVIGELHEAAEAIDCLDKLVRDQFPPVSATRSFQVPDDLTRSGRLHPTTARHDWQGVD